MINSAGRCFLLVLVAVLCSACAKGRPNPAQPCSKTLPCPPPAVCDLPRGVCVSLEDGGAGADQRPPATDGSEDRSPLSDLPLAPDAPRGDLTLVPDAGCPTPLTPCGGTCVDLSLDPEHCGKCNNPCGPHATCAAESCGCQPGYESCDGSWSNGCEVTLASDPLHCGKCNNPCGPHATCAAGSCQCQPGWFNCNSSWSGGCECAGGCTASACLNTGLASWTACTQDEACASKWCGCNGTTVKQCLPDVTFPKTCAIPDGSPCSFDAECVSKWCGCNSNPSRRCLPSTSYTKSCSALPHGASCSLDAECAGLSCGCSGGGFKQCLPPGNPKGCALASWAECMFDAECQGARCGCNGGTVKVCLPNTSYPKTCAIPNWAPCTADAECVSKWCGCNGGILMRCLPSSAYPKTCS